MRSLALMVGAAVVALAAPASAQVLGGISGNVGGGVSVRPGDLGVRDTVGATRDFTRETVRGTRHTVDRDHSASASVGVPADGDAGVSSDGTSVGLDARVGARVRARDGDTLGEVVGFTHATANRAGQVLVRSADGAVRGIEAARVSAEVRGEVMANLTAREFHQRPAEMPDNTRRDPASGDHDQIY
ncbi:MAG: hypothetical protein J0L52_10915 [Caulobacterales bacterium]|nr:hypothetical protein [Caulobacterales bacterium]